LAHENLLRLVSHHGNNSVIYLGLPCRNKMLRPVRIVVVNGTRCVFLMPVVSSHLLLTNLALIPHGFLHGPAPGRGPVFADP